MTWQHQPASDIPRVGYQDVFIELQRWIWSKKSVNPDVKKSMFSNQRQTAAVKDKALNLTAYKSSCLILFLLMYICFLVRQHTWLIFILNKTTPTLYWTQAFNFLKWKSTGVCALAPAVRQSGHTHRHLHEWSWGRAGEQFQVPGNNHHRQPVTLFPFIQILDSSAHCCKAGWMLSQNAPLVCT